jgi:hypothetical protein
MAGGKSMAGDMRRRDVTSRGGQRTRSAGASLGLALALLVLSVQPPAFAANFTGCKWPSAAIFFKNNFSGAYLTQGNDATQNWSNATVISLFQVTSNPDFTQINGNYGSTGWEGLTSWSCSGGIMVKGALIQINEFYANAHPPNKKQALIAHELGHVVGLAHRTTSTCSNRSLMFPTVNGIFDVCGIYTVQPDDAAGTDTLY